jgi:uroporphyrinogen decarboxylase
VAFIAGQIAEARMNRIQEAQLGIPDRVPVYGQIHEFAMARSGVSAREFYSNGKLLVESIVETAREFDLDDPHINYDTYTIEAEAMGMEVIYYDDRAPQLEPTDPLIKEKSDLANLKLPAFGESGRMPFVLDVMRAYQEAGLPAKWHPSMSYTAPFTLASRIRGVEELLRDVLSDPVFVHDLLAFLTEGVLIPWIETLNSVNKTGVALVGGADALASPPFLGVRHLREFALPYLMMIRERFADEGVVQNYWGEGIVAEPRELLEFKRESSPKVLVVQDPDLAKVGPDFFKDFAVEHDMTLTLGVGADVMTTMTPAEIAERVKHYVEVGKRGGKFLLYLCSVDAATPPENLEAAVASVREHGSNE